MVRKLICILVILVVLSACKTERYVPNYPLTTIVGKWRWYKSFGFGYLATPSSTSQDWYLEFRSDSSFKSTGSYIWRTGTPDTIGTFSLMGCSNCAGSPSPAPYCVSMNIGGINRPAIPYVIRSMDTLMIDFGGPCDRPIAYFAREQ